MDGSHGIRWGRGSSCCFRFIASKEGFFEGHSLIMFSILLRCDGNEQNAPAVVILLAVAGVNA